MVDKKKPSRKKAGYKAVVEHDSGEVEGTNNREEQVLHAAIKGRIESFSYHTPLPSPKDLAEYDKIVPGAATRLLRMAEKSQNLTFTERFGGQLLAFFLAGGLGSGFLFVTFHVSKYSFIPLSTAAAAFGGGAAILYALRGRKKD